MTALHRELRQHAHDSKLLDLCSGLQRVVERFDAVLVEHARSEDAPTRDHVLTDAMLVDAVLGAIAIRNRLASAFAAAPPPVHDAPVDTPAPESLLR
jgi:hypothetical protein